MLFRMQKPMILPSAWLPGMTEEVLRAGSGRVDVVRVMSQGRKAKRPRRRWIASKRPFVLNGLDLQAGAATSPAPKRSLPFLVSPGLEAYSGFPRRCR